MEAYYFQALAEDQRNEVADIWIDFPALSKDVNFPQEILIEKIYSSVLRVSSPNWQLWTHYDVSNSHLF